MATDFTPLDFARLCAALGTARDEQLETWAHELASLHLAAGMAPEKAWFLAYRQAETGRLLSDGYEPPEIIARIGCSERTYRRDVAALRQLLEPRTTFLEERAA
jgi:hypothetical protein